ncbi:hypothetical protein BJ165DRAFT_1598231 [Panaeolus papilionaceus]|nr:hypothetical protein BJ165DRAFT_1598231 [Panaeolus papilionaceus]
MHFPKSRRERTPDLEGHAPRMLPPTSSNRDTGRYHDDHHHPSRSERPEYSHGHDRNHRRRESYSPPPHHRSRHEYDDYDDHSRRDRHRDRSRHSTHHHSTLRRRESQSPSHYHDRRPSHDDDRLRSDGHYRHRLSDHGHHHSSGHHTRPAFERRRSRSVDDYFSSRRRDGRHAPVYYHYQSGSYVPIPLHGDALDGAARTHTMTTTQGPAVVPSHGRQPTVVPVDGGRGGWIVVPPVGHSVSLMEPKTISGHPTSTAVANASHTATRGSSIVPQSISSPPAASTQPTTTINIAHPYASVQPAPGAVQAVPSTSQRSTRHQPRQQVLQPIQPTQVTATPSTTASRKRSPPQIPRMSPSNSRRPQRLTVPQPLAGAPSTSPRSAGVAATTPLSVTLAPPGHPVPSGIQSAYMAPYGAGNSGSVPSAAPTPHRKRGNGKSGFASGWGFFGSGKSRRSRGTSL